MADKLTYMFNTLSQHHLVENFSSIESNKSAPVSHMFACKKPVSSTYESSISGTCLFCKGETSFLLKSWLNAGLGTGLDELLGMSQFESSCVHICGSLATYGAGAAAVVWSRFLVSVGFFIAAVLL